jgi:dienelactone hydrolase
VPNLFTGQYNFTQINSQLTTSIPALLKSDFLTGFSTSSKFASVREALDKNSISGWKTNVPLLMVHGTADTQVYSSATENMYAAMVQAGSSMSTVTKVMIPGADHSSGLAPAMVMGFWFINNIKNSR